MNLDNLWKYVKSPSQELFEEWAQGKRLLEPSLFGDVLQRYRLSEVLPYRVFDDKHGLFFNEQSVGFLIEMTPFVGGGSSVQDQFTSLFQYILPPGSCIQFHLWASDHIEPLLNHWAHAHPSSDKLYQKMISERRAYLLSAPPKGAPLRDYRLFVSVSLPRRHFNSQGSKRFLEVKKQVFLCLDSLKMNPRTCSVQALMGLIQDILGYSPESGTYNPLEAISMQTLPSDDSYRVHSDHIECLKGGRYLESYTVRKFNSPWSLSGMDTIIGSESNNFLQIPTAFMLHYGVYINDDSQISRKITQKQATMDYQANVPNLRKYIPSLDFQIAEWDFVRAKFDEGQRLIKTRFQILLRGEMSQRTENEQALRNHLQTHRWKIENDRFIQLPSLLSTLPMTWGEGVAQDSIFFSKAKTTLSYEPGNLLPVLAEWKGTSTPGLVLSGRRGQVFFWHPFDNDAGNYNVCVVGRSGSGKSVFMQELVTSILGMGGRVTILDVGRSFEKTIKLLGGEFIEFSTHSPICINPFSSIPLDDPEAASDALAMLKPILSLMAAPTRGTSDLENAYLEEALLSVWRDEGVEATITHIAKWLKKQPEDTAQKLGKMLGPYAEGGTYARFFNGPSTIDLSNPAVVVELEELKERKDLQAVVVQMIILQVTNQIYLGDRQTPSCLVLDEAWDMLRGTQSGVFIETAARRLRKYYGSLVTGTQSVNDFYATPGAQAAFENSDWMCLLSQKKESLAQLKASGRLTMEGGLEEALKSVHTKQGHYAEIMFIMPNSGYVLGRLILDPFSQLLYSTKAEEYAAVKSLESKGYTIAEAIEILADANRGEGG